MFKTDRSALVSTLLTTLALTLLPLIIFNKYPLTHEGLRYAHLTAQFNHAIFAGDWVPRWLPDLAGGYGCPTFVFYQPLFFWTTFALSWLPGGDSITVFYATALFLSLGSVGAYRVGRHWGTPRFASFASIIFLLTPYVFLNLYIRGDLTELSAIMIAPWTIHFLLQVVDRVAAGQSGVVPGSGLAISLAAIVYAHPATALLYWPVFFVLALAIVLSQREHLPRLVLVLSAVAICALALSCPYWYPVFSLKDEVGLERATSGHFYAASHVVHPLQLIKRDWPFGGSTPNDYNDTMSFQLGLPHLLLTAWGIYLGRRRIVVVVSGILYVCLLLLMTGLSQWVWQTIEVLQLVQFPWRILGCTAIIQLYCISQLADRFDVQTPVRWRHTLTTAVIVVSVVWYAGMFKVRGERGTLLTSQVIVDQDLVDVRSRFETYSGVDEFLPRSAEPSLLTPLGDRDLLFSDNDQTVVTHQNPGNRQRMMFEVSHASSDRLILNQFYFPGWQVVVNDVQVTNLADGKTPDGRIQIPVTGRGTSTVSAHYAGPPGERACWAIAFGLPSCCLLLGFAAGKMRAFRRSKMDTHVTGLAA